MGLAAQHWELEDILDHRTRDATWHTRPICILVLKFMRGH